jgi:hypothetical protein
VDVAGKNAPGRQLKRMYHKAKKAGSATRSFKAFASNEAGDRLVSDWRANKGRSGRGRHMRPYFERPVVLDANAAA